MGDEPVVLQNQGGAQCNECGGTDFVDDSSRGDTICRGCGFVLPDRLRILEAEWRSFSSEPSSNNRNRISNLNPLFESVSSTQLDKVCTTSAIPIPFDIPLVIERNHFHN